FARSATPARSARAAGRPRGWQTFVGDGKSAAVMVRSRRRKPMPRRKLARGAVVMVAALGLSSCATMQQGVEDNPKAGLATLPGPAAGGGIAALAGGGPGAIAGAAVGGALIGGFIGHHLDNRDKQMASAAAQRAFENNQSGQPSVWRNP